MPEKKTSNRVLDDTPEQLEAVKKGQPRRFVMLIKGASIEALAVFKRGKTEGIATKLRAIASGQVVSGTVVGGGADIRFQVLRSEHPQAPAKSGTLKTFLADEADFACRPMFEILDMLPPVLDAADPLVQRFLALQPKALEVADARPEQAAKLSELCLKIGRLLESNEGQDAELLLTELGSLLGNAPASSPPPGPSDDLAAKWQERAKSIAPKLIAALKDVPTSATELRGVFDWAQARAKEGDYAKALAALDRLEGLIAKLAPDGPKETDSIAKDTVAKGREQLIAAFRKLSQVWVAVRGKVEADMKQLETAMRKEFAGDEELLKQTDVNAPKLYAVLDRLDTRLIDKLKEAEQTKDDAELTVRRKEARELVVEYRQFVMTDRLMSRLDENPFVTLTTQATILKTLDSLLKALV